MKFIIFYILTFVLTFARLSADEKPHTNNNSDGTVFAYNNISKQTGSVDTLANKKNYIRYVSNNLGLYKVAIELEEYDIEIEISVYNLLGKKVLEVFDGTAREGVEYDFYGSKLPNGIYLCILQGKEFRDAEKILVSR
ncbi:MAG: hypothetical protein ACOC2K_04015 [Bacteroidota bacterium]